MFDISEYFQIAQNKTKKNIIETINCVIIKEGKKTIQQQNKSIRSMSNYFVIQPHNLSMHSWSMLSLHVWYGMVWYSMYASKTKQHCCCCCQGWGSYALHLCLCYDAMARIDDPLSVEWWKYFVSIYIANCTMCQQINKSTYKLNVWFDHMNHHY